MDQITVSPWIFPGLRGIVREPFNYETTDKIITCVCSKYNITREDLFKKSHKAEYVYIRQLLHYFLLTRMRGVTTKGIGKLFGKDHSTVIHGRDSFKDRLETNAIVPGTLHAKYRNTKTDYEETFKIIIECL